MNSSPSRAILTGNGWRRGDGLRRRQRRAGHARARRGLPGTARVDPQDLRALSRRLLAQARRRAGLSDRVYRGTDPGRVSRLADPRGIWRLGPAAARRRGDPRRDQRLAAAPPARATPRCTSWARCCGTAAPSRKQRYLPKIASGELRLQAFGVTEPTTGSDTTKLKTRAVREGNALCRQRAEGVDLARPTLRSDAAVGAHDAGRGGQAPHRRALGVSDRSAREPRQGRRDPADRGDDQPQHDRGVFRQSEGPAR